MDVFTPTSRTQPYKRSGEVATTVRTPFENLSTTRRRHWPRSPVKVSYTFHNTHTNLLIDFAFIKAKGGYTAFKYKDVYEDTVTDEAVGTGTGARTVYFLDRKYIDAASLVVSLNGTPTATHTLSSEAGKLTFSPAPGNGVVITASYEFYRKMFFDIAGPDDIKMEHVQYSIWRMEVPMVEDLL